MSAAASGASIRSLIAAAEGSGARVGLYARRPDGEFFGYRDDEVFPSASTIKIGIMIELFRRIDAGEFDLDQRHQLRATDQAAGSGVLQHLDRGLNPTLRDLCYLMMSISDNLATNIIIGLLGLDRVNATLGSLGLTVSVLGRPMQGRPAQRLRVVHVDPQGHATAGRPAVYLVAEDLVAAAQARAGAVRTSA